MALFKTPRKYDRGNLSCNVRWDITAPFEKSLRTCVGNNFFYLDKYTFNKKFTHFYLFPRSYSIRALPRLVLIFCYLPVFYWYRNRNYGRDLGIVNPILFIRTSCYFWRFAREHIPFFQRKHLHLKAEKIFSTLLEVCVDLYSDFITSRKLFREK